MSQPIELIWAEVDTGIASMPKAKVYGIRGDTVKIKEEIKKVTRQWNPQLRAWILPQYFTHEERVEFTQKMNSLLGYREQGDGIAPIYKERAAAYAEIHQQAGFPLFFPPDGICSACNQQIFAVLDPAKNNYPITGCPICNRSYCD
jgi:hypothetical protein